LALSLERARSAPGTAKTWNWKFIEPALHSNQGSRRFQFRILYHTSAPPIPSQPVPVNLKLCFVQCTFTVSPLNCSYLPIPLVLAPEQFTCCTDPSGITVLQLESSIAKLLCLPTSSSIQRIKSDSCFVQDPLHTLAHYSNHNVWRNLRVPG
jgi:hypothetical protein